MGLKLSNKSILSKLKKKFNTQFLYYYYLARVAAEGDLAPYNHSRVMPGSKIVRTETILKLKFYVSGGKTATLQRIAVQ